MLYFCLLNESSVYKYVKMKKKKNEWLKTSRLWNGLPSPISLSDFTIFPITNLSMSFSLKVGREFLRLSSDGDVPSCPTNCY